MPSCPLKVYEPRPPKRTILKFRTQPYTNPVPIKCFTNSASWPETSDRTTSEKSSKIGQSNSVVPFTAQEAFNSVELADNVSLVMLEELCASKPNFVKSYEAKPSQSNSPVRKPEGRDSRKNDARESAVEVNRALLAKYGINVRDFAYESTLPPIPPVHYVPQQIIRGSRPLKRSRPYDEEGDDIGRERRNKSPRSSPPSQDLYLVDSQVTNPLERGATVPRISATLSPVSTQLLLASFGLEQYASSRHLNGDKLPPTTPQRRTQLSSLQLTGNSSISTPHYSTSYSGAQDDEPWVDTPLVTPNGSLQRAVLDNCDESANPDSPDSPLASRADTPTPCSRSSTSTPPRTSPPNSERAVSSPEPQSPPRHQPRQTYHLRSRAINVTPPPSRPSRARKARSLSSSPKRPSRTKQAMKLQRRPSKSVPPRRSARIAQKSRERRTS